MEILRRIARNVGALARLGFLEAVAYRASMAVWILTTTFPLVSLALWYALAESGPIGTYDGPAFVAYFVAAFVIRQLTAAWVVWDLERHIRLGELDALLLRPTHPVLHHAMLNLTAIPIRVALALPIAFAVLLTTGVGSASIDGWRLALVPIAIVLAWMIHFLGQLCFACLAFWSGRSASVYEIWIALYIVLSGYAVPTSLLPAGLADIARALPFHASLGFPVELLVGQGDAAAVRHGFALQLVWVLVLGGIAHVAWRRGLAAYGAEGG
jgi:ABC-2 type transport system permease protein